MLQILLKALSSIALKVIATLATEQMLEWLLFKTAKMVTDSTKTKLDNDFLEEFEKNYKKSVK